MMSTGSDVTFGESKSGGVRDNAMTFPARSSMASASTIALPIPPEAPKITIFAGLLNELIIDMAEA